MDRLRILIFEHKRWYEGGCVQYLFICLSAEAVEELF